MLEEFSNDIERIQAMQNMLIAISTGEQAKSSDYAELRNYLLENSEYKQLLPSFIRTNRELNQFWPFIKNKYGTYAELAVNLSGALSLFLISTFNERGKT